METVELVVYLSVAVIIGSLMLAFIGGWDAQGTYEGFKDLFGDGDATAYERVPVERLPRVSLEVWDACGLGSINLSKTVYLTGDGTYNRSDLFASIKRSNLCKSLQSASEACGTKEDVVFTAQLAIPTVVSVRCEIEQLIIE